MLVRERPGIKEERLGLTPLFEGDFDGPGYSREAVLRRWNIEKEDVNESDSAVLAGTRARASYCYGNALWGL